MIEQIAYYLKRKDEEPNIKLAEKLVNNEDVKGIAEIINGLDNENEPVVNDCIKVLYEIGYRNKQLIASYAEIFVKKLKSKNNRLIWGSCIALSLIADLSSDYLYNEFDTIYHVYEKGSVITRDNCISIFAGIIKGNIKYNKKVFPVIIEHLKKCKPKEVGQHSERAFICVNKTNAEEFKEVLLSRYDSLTESQKKRVDKLLKKIENKSFTL